MRQRLRLCQTVSSFEITTSFI